MEQDGPPHTPMGLGTDTPLARLMRALERVLAVVLFAVGGIILGCIAWWALGAIVMSQVEGDKEPWGTLFVFGLIYVIPLSGICGAVLGVYRTRRKAPAATPPATG
jgi:hypothetical protein